MTKISLCVAGWHLKPSLYSHIARLVGVNDLYVASHKPVDSILKPILTSQGFKTHEFINTSYDWGCYQQWLDLGLWKNYDYCFFIHDDVVIKSPSLIQTCVSIMKEKKLTMIGNGPNGNGKTNWAKTHKKYFDHATWKPPEDFEYLTVRGSFFGLPRNVIEAIGGKFEVNWNGKSLKDANTSLVATCAKIAYFGGNKIDYLSDTYMHSDYLIEIYRGQKFDIVPKKKAISRELAMKLFHERVKRLKR